MPQINPAYMDDVELAHALWTWLSRLDPVAATNIQEQWRVAGDGSAKDPSTLSKSYLNLYLHELMENIGRHAPEGYVFMRGPDGCIDFWSTESPLRRLE